MGVMPGALLFVQIGRKAGASELLPVVFHLSDFSHVGHRASSVEVGENGDLARAG
jgi:hypothetical protein